MTPTTIVIPAYNAARTLPAVIARLPDELDERAARVLIVDDGSIDATVEVARALARRDRRLELIVRRRNGGYGAAMKDGLAVAVARGSERAVALHADGQYAPEILPALLAALAARGLDLLQGSRIASGTALSGGMPLYKYAAGRTLTALENRVLGLDLTDYHSGYLVYGGRALRRIPLARLSDSFDFDLEVIACARARRLCVGEHPVPTHYGDEVSHLNPITYGLRALRVMLNYRLGRYHDQR
jgi:glycosyltransferase involved in cell wall biosynthesis